MQPLTETDYAMALIGAETPSIQATSSLKIRNLFEYQEVDTPTHLTAIPLSAQNRKILYDRGDKLFEQLSGTEKCKGVTETWFKSLPPIGTLGSIAGGIVGVSCGSPLSRDLIWRLWEIAFPHGERSWLGRMWETIFFVGKAVSTAVFTPRLNPVIQALTGIAGSIAAPVAISLTAGLYNKVVGDRPSLKELEEGSLDNLLRYDSLLKCYFTASNEPLTARDVQKIVEYAREYNLICELLTVQRGDLRRLVSDGIEGYEHELADHRTIIEKGLCELEDTFGEKKIIKPALAAMAKFYANGRGTSAVIQQAHFKEALEALDELQKVFRIPHGAQALCYDEKSNLLYVPANSIAHWWQGQTISMVSDKVKHHLHAHVAQKLFKVITELNLHGHLNYWEIAELNIRFDLFEQEMKSFCCHLESIGETYSPFFTPPSMEDKALLLCEGGRLCKNVTTMLDWTRTQVSTQGKLQ